MDPALDLYSSSSQRPSPPSEREAEVYYANLPSCPRLVARSSTTPWQEPVELGGYPIRRQLYPVYEHRIQEFWKCGLADELHTLLDSMMVDWTSIDVFRIGNMKESDKSAFPVILWIGVTPKSLSGPKGVDVAMECWTILQARDLPDVQVEIRESIVARSARPELLPPARKNDPLADICEPLATTVGLSLSAKTTPFAEGTGGFFFTEGSDTKQLFLVTARHVVFPPDKGPDKGTENSLRAKNKAQKNDNNEYENAVKIDIGNNKPFHRRSVSTPRHDVMLFGDAKFRRYLESIQARIEGNRKIIKAQESDLKQYEGQDGPEIDELRGDAYSTIAKVNKVTQQLKALQRDVSARWSATESRIIGHVKLSPAIMANVSSKGYYEDWAVIEIDRSKINSNNFQGNAIDIRCIKPEDLPNAVYQNFKYPAGGLLKVQGTISDEEMRRSPVLPPELDDKDPCHFVFKSGITSGLTLGRANGIESKVRSDKTSSYEWAIAPFGTHRGPFPGPFSEPGDSGSVVVDGRGRIGGLITGGSGMTKFVDITYATPISFLLDRMKAKGLHPNLNPVLSP